VSDLDYSIITRPLNNDTDSGDWGMVRQEGDSVFIAIIDVLGHGASAQTLADVCKTFWEEHFRKKPGPFLSALHKHIKGSRGCVAAFCHLNVSSGVLTYTNTGNTVLRRVGEKNERGISQPGTIGYQIRTPLEKTMTLADGDLLILHTDGISSSMGIENLSPMPEDTQTVATYIMEQYGKEQDDALCIVLKYVT